ncbi:GTP-binding protein, partial [Micromonospora sp. M51]|nr:GTP-binding protein [Micromonospora sp. M51]
CLHGELPVRLDTEVRAALLGRFGVFGVRLAATLVRSGFDSRVKLSAELIRRSGLTELRESVTRCFIDRRDALKARSALAAVEALLRSEPTRGSAELVGAVEQILAGAHEFRELRLLVALRNTRLGFDAELAAEAQRLVGGDGVGLAARLGVEHEADVRRLWEAASEAQWRWRDRAEDPLLPLAQRRGAQVVVRSCEGMIAELVAGGR